jgi:predicted SAM-dependent methyltransferase
MKRLARKIIKLTQPLSFYYRVKKRAKGAPLKLVIGSCGIFDPGWIGTDAHYLNLLRPYHWRRYFQKNSIDALLAEHVWEHLTLEEGLIAAQICYEYLKPGGYVRIAVPDGYHPDPAYIRHVQVNGTGPGSDDHKVLYNHETLTTLFQQAGFSVALLEHFDNQGVFQSAQWDPARGKIHRSQRFDERNVGGQLTYTSVVLDAIKEK